MDRLHEVVVPEYRQGPSTSSQDLMDTSRGDTDLSNTCRLCTAVSETLVPIFDGEGLQNNIADKINEYLPVKVNVEDSLPLTICYQCMSTVLAWHDLVLCCVQADSALRAREPVVSTVQELNHLENLDSEDKDEKSKACSDIKYKLEEYLSLLRLEEVHLGVACHKCRGKPSFTVEQFAEHMYERHRAATGGLDALVGFVREHATFQEPLDTEGSDRERSPAARAAPPAARYRCPACAHAFTSVTRLANHAARHRAVTCCGTEYRAGAGAELAAHVRAAHATRPPAHSCMTCGHTARDAAALRDHVRRAHPAPPRPPRRALPDTNQKAIPAVCPDCGLVFSNKYNMFAHMNRHGTPPERHICETCDRVYSTPGNLRAHERVAHRGELPHACSYCGERFATTNGRDMHALVHREPTLACSRCPAAFRHPQSLRRHEEAHRGRRAHSCGVCRRRFARRSHLTRHARAHTAAPQ